MRGALFLFGFCLLALAYLLYQHELQLRELADYQVELEAKVNTKSAAKPARKPAAKPDVKADT